MKTPTSVLVEDQYNYIEDYPNISYPRYYKRVLNVNEIQILKRSNLHIVYVMSTVLTQEATSIHEATNLLFEETDTEHINVRILEISRDRFQPEELSIPPEDHRNIYKFYTVSYIIEDTEYQGHAIRNSSRTYGKPIRIEVEMDSATSTFFEAELE